MTIKLFFRNLKSQSCVNPKIVEALTRTRINYYKPTQISKITNEEFGGIKSLIFTLADKILVSNYQVSENEVLQLMDAKNQLKATLSHFLEHQSKLEVVTFAGQLLQYYTVLCDEDFNKQSTLEDFLSLLKRKENTFGLTNNNVFICEYMFIKLYNDLCQFEDTLTKNIARPKNPLAILESLNNQLTSLLSQINKWMIDAPDNIFIDYLNFIANYTLAKSLEIRFILLKSNLDDNQQYDISNQQQHYIDEAKESLEKIQELYHSVSDRGMRQPKGVEFCLGKELFEKLPAQKIEQLQSHLASLA